MVNEGGGDEDKDLFHGVERCMHTFILIACMGPNRTIKEPAETILGMKSGAVFDTNVPVMQKVVDPG